MHGKHSWKVEGSSNQNASIAQLLSSEVVEYIRRKPGVCFSFSYKPDGFDQSTGERNKARAEIQYYNGSWHTIYGGTAKPVNDRWIMTQANGPLPATTTQVKVLIRGYAYNGQAFKAWIDGASLSVYYSKTDDSEYGKVTFATNIFHSAAMQIPEFDGFVSGGIGVTANASGSYKIYSVEVKIELLPNDGSSTTQVGRIFTLYSGESNDQNQTMGSGIMENENSGLAAALTAIQIGSYALGTAILIFQPVGSFWYATQWVLVAVDGGTLAYDVHRTMASAYFDHDCAAEGQTDYYSKDEWKYFNKAP